MRGLISGILLCLAATALHAQITIIHTPASLHPLPLVYTGKTPAIFLPDSKPTQPYIATHIVEVSADISVETNELISKLQERGMAEGVDGILLYSLGQKVIGPAGGIATLNGVGIKYKDSVNYLDNIIRQRVVTTYDADEKPGPSVILNYNWRGSFENAIDAEGHDFMVDSILPFDAHLLLLLKPEMYAYQFGYDKQLQRIKADKTTAQDLNIQWVPSSYSKGKFVVRINDGYNTESRFELELMNEQKTVAGAIVTYRNEPFLYSYFEYDSKGRIVAEKWYKVKGSKKRLWLSFDNRFHSNDTAQWPAK